MVHLLSLSLLHDQDVVTARQRAAQIAALADFDSSEQTRIATAVSEIVRNAFRYARAGAVDFGIDTEARPQRLIVVVRDEGPGIPRLEDVLSGRYPSSTGMGNGIVGARRLMDRFAIESSSSGTTVTLEKFLPPTARFVTAERAADIARGVKDRRPQGLVEEVQEQNQALLRALDELQRKQQELVHLNRELEDTNRGVLALYAELDEKADHLRRADELKSRFLSNMTHEFRTPVNAIVGLCNLMEDDRQRDGLPVEPELQYIRKAAEQLSDLVNDLLDLAKVEAGKTVVRPASFEVDNLFGALRGMLRPLLLNQSVTLVFDYVAETPPLFTDEAKISQILRNLISNALKFTERGEVRVSAESNLENDRIVFTVADTGIGIAVVDQDRIFEEFTQIEHRLQRGVKGTGLGLALSRRLAELLGGSLTLESAPGIGSTFRLAVPMHYRAAGRAAAVTEWAPVAGRIPLLLVEDAANEQRFFEKLLKSSRFQIYPAHTVEEALRALEVVRPGVIALDVVLGGEEAWDLLLRFKRDARLRNVPVVVVSALEEREKALALGADEYLVKPVQRRTLIDTLTRLHDQRQAPLTVLTVDDEEVARYLVRQCLPPPGFTVMEASSPAEGLARARKDQPDVILLDLLMPPGDGREVLRELRADPSTAHIPIVIVTASALGEAERSALLGAASAVLDKRDVTRDVLPGVVRRAGRPGDSPI